MTKEISRRSFLSVSALAAGAAAMAAVGCTPAEEKPAEQQSAADAAAPAIEASPLTGWAGTPAEIAALGGSTMPLEDLNEYRRKYVEAQTDYTMADGTVVPAVFVKVRALINTYGMGCGSNPDDTAWSAILEKFNEEEAQAYLDMPWGVAFTAVEFAAKSGRALEECKDLCNRIADYGYLCRFETANGTAFHQVPFFQGVIEYHFTDVIEQPGYNVGIMNLATMPEGLSKGGSPVFYTVPVDKSVTTDGTVLPFDDLEQIIRNKNLLAIAPCYCRYKESAAADPECPSFEDFATGQFEDYMSPQSNMRVETCLMMGTEAEYWIGRGWAREITADQAVAYMERSRDDGFILNSSFGKNTETVCSCHTDCGCGILTFWKLMGDPATIGSANAFKNISHYVLEHDAEACLACGICEKRCPLHAITMDGEGGKPVINEMCMACGQCATVCPQEARKLAQKPDEEILELPQGFLEDNNMKAAYRFEHGLIA